MPSPGRMRLPSGRGGAQQFRLGRKIDDVGDPEIRPQSVRRAAGIPGYFAMPTGVALTMPVGARAPPPRGRGPTAARAAAARGREARREARRLRRSRSKTSICSAPRSTSARATALPAPPAPSSRTEPELAPCIPRRKLSAKPQQSVLWPIGLARPEHDRVDRADRGGLGGELVELGDDALLERMRDVEAGEAVLRGKLEHRSDRRSGSSQPRRNRSASRNSRARAARLPPCASTASATPGCRRRSAPRAARAAGKPAKSASRISASARPDLSCCVSGTCSSCGPASDAPEALLFSSPFALAVALATGSATVYGPVSLVNRAAMLSPLRSAANGCRV